MTSHGIGVPYGSPHTPSGPSAQESPVPTNPPSTAAGDSGPRKCHAVTSTGGLHHVGRGHWVRNAFVTITGAVRALAR